MHIPCGQMMLPRVIVKCRLMITTPNRDPILEGTYTSDQINDVSSWCPGKHYGYIIMGNHIHVSVPLSMNWANFPTRQFWMYVCKTKNPHNHTFYQIIQQLSVQCKETFLPCHIHWDERWMTICEQQCTTNCWPITKDTPTSLMTPTDYAAIGWSRHIDNDLLTYTEQCLRTYIHSVLQKEYTCVQVNRFTTGRPIERAPKRSGSYM